MPDLLAEEMRKTAAAKAPDRKTGRLARLFCEQCFQIKDVRIVDDRKIVGTNLDFDFTNELAVIGVVNEMCLAYGLTMEMEKHQQNWVVTIYLPDDRYLRGRPFATGPILRRAILQAAICAHSTYVLPSMVHA